MICAAAIGTDECIVLHRLAEPGPEQAAERNVNAKRTNGPVGREIDPPAHQHCRARDAVEGDNQNGGDQRVVERRRGRNLRCQQHIGGDENEVREAEQNRDQIQAGKAPLGK